MRHPALVFSAALMGAIDAAYAEDHSRETIDTGIIDNVLVCGPFGTPIGAVEGQRTIFINTRQP
jgi:hypothetical protein